MIADNLKRRLNFTFVGKFLGPVISTLNGVMSSANNYATSTTAVANNKKKAKRARGKTMENKDGINSTKFSSLTNSTSSTNNVFCNGGTVVVSHAESGL